MPTVFFPCFFSWQFFREWNGICFGHNQLYFKELSTFFRKRFCYGKSYHISSEFLICGEKKFIISWKLSPVNEEPFLSCLQMLLHQKNKNKNKTKQKKLKYQRRIMNRSELSKPPEKILIWSRRKGPSSSLVRASPVVLNMWLCTVKLGEEKFKICQFCLRKWFWINTLALVAVAGERHITSESTKEYKIYDTTAEQCF